MKAAGPKCYNCQQFGHIARTCPNPTVAPGSAAAVGLGPSIPTVAPVGAFPRMGGFAMPRGGYAGGGGRGGFAGGVAAGGPRESALAVAMWQPFMKADGCPTCCRSLLRMWRGRSPGAQLPDGSFARCAPRPADVLQRTSSHHDCSSATRRNCAHGHHRFICSASRRVTYVCASFESLSLRGERQLTYFSLDSDRSRLPDQHCAGRCRHDARSAARGDEARVETAPLWLQEENDVTRWVSSWCFDNCIRTFCEMSFIAGEREERSAWEKDESARRRQERPAARAKDPAGGRK